MSHATRSAAVGAVIFAVGGCATTLGVALAIESVRAATPSGPRAPTQTTSTERPAPIVFESGGPPPPSALDGAVFPSEQYVVEGIAGWEPLLLLWRDPQFRRDSRDRCRERLSPMSSGEVCPVEYTFLLTRGKTEHRTTYARAALPPSASDACRIYAQCRLPDFLGRMPAVPLPGSGQTLAVIDRVHYSNPPHDRTESQRQIDKRLS